MSGSRFTLDSNILVYALDRQAGERHRLASVIIDRAVLLDCRVTLQAISEFFAVCVRTRLVPIDEAMAQACDWLDMFATAAASADAIRAALSLATSRRASYWDALLVTTAAEAGCSAILTDDLGSGTVLAGVRVVHPFDGARLSPEAEALLAE